MSKDRTLRKLLKLLGNAKKTLFFVFLFVLIGNVSLLIAPKRIGSTIDAIFAGEPWTGILLSILLFYGTGMVCLWISARLAVRISNEAANTLRKNLFEKLSRLPLSYFDGTPHGDIISRFSNDVEAVSDSGLPSHGPSLPAARS